MKILFQPKHVPMKMPLRPIIAVSLLSSLPLTAQVNQSQIIPFQAGTPARAADMNQNIDELIRAVNENTAQLKALQDQMSIIASVINLPQPTLQQNLAGSVYKLGIMETGIGASSHRNGLTEIGNMRHNMFNESGDLTLNVDGSASYAFNGKEREFLLDINSGFHADDPNSPFPAIIDVNVSNSGTWNEVDTITGTWSVSGNVLTLNVDGDTETFFVSTDGNSLLNNAIDADNGDPNITMHSSSLDVGIRISKPQPNLEVQIDSVSGGHVHIDPPNNGTPFLNNDTNGKLIVIKNTGTGNLVLGSSALIQDPGGDFTFAGQTGSVTIAPGAEHSIEFVNPLSQGSTRKDAAIYLMTNDPDTPTFIYNFYSTNNP